MVPDAALVIDALGGEARTSIIDFYTNFQLREYRRIFRATDEAGQLDNVSRRFAWFRRILKVYDDDHATMFEEAPIKSWGVAKELTRKFTEVTREDLRSVLIRSQGRVQVPVLLEALHASIEFEKSMSRRFQLPVSDFHVSRRDVVHETHDRSSLSRSQDRRHLPAQLLARHHRQRSHRHLTLT